MPAGKSAARKNQEINANTRLNEVEQDWSITLHDARVQHVCIDFQLRLLIVDALGEVRLTIESQCQLQTTDSEATLYVNEATTFSLALALVNAQVSSLTVEKHGALGMNCANG